MTVRYNFLSKGDQIPSSIRCAVRNSLVVLAIFSLTLLGVPVSIIPGFGLILALGFFLRISILGKPDWQLASYDGALRGFAEANGFALLALAPISYLVPFLLVPTNFPSLVLIMAIGFAITSGFRSYSSENSENSISSPNQESQRTAMIVLATWLAILILDVLVVVRALYFSFDGQVFLFNDLTSHLGIIQSIANGVQPLNNLTQYGMTYNVNPLSVTISLGFSGLLMSVTGLQAFGDVFFVIVNAYIHALVVPLLYYVARAISPRIQSWVIVVASLGIGVGMDLAPVLQSLGLQTALVLRGLVFPFDRPDGVATTFFVPGYGRDAFFAAFHHDLPLIMFLFFMGLILPGRKDIKTPYLVAFLAAIEIPFFHLGIGVYFLLAIIIAAFGLLIFELLRLENVKLRFLILKLLTGAAVLGFFLMRDIVSLFIVMTPRYTGGLIVLSLLGYLGPFIVLTAFGYLWVYQSDRTIPKWIVITSIDFILLMVLIFSSSRDSGIGVMPSDYFPLFALQGVFILCFLLGFGFHTQSRMASEAIADASQTTPFTNIRRFAMKMERNHRKAITSIAILSVVVLAGMTAGWSLYANEGEFNLAFYKVVPSIYPDERDMFLYIYENTNYNDTILIDPYNWEITAVIGRQILYSAYRTPDENNSNYQAVIAMYNSTESSEYMPLFTEYNIRLVVISPLEREHFPVGIMKFYSSPDFELVFAQGGYDVLTFNQ
ncbi:MAG: hypothetical protein ACFFFC_13095 [Candidatus Thorarchaeota archaeon]